MAERQVAFWRLIAALTLAVMLLHWAVITWLSSPWVQPSVLRAMTAPLFTRTLRPAVAAPAQPRAASARRQTPRARTAAAPALTPPPTPVPQPETGPSLPTPMPTPVPAASEEPAHANPLPTAPTPSEPELPITQAADTWPANTRLRYVVGGNYRGALHGDAQVQWQRDGERYQVQLEVSIGWLAHLSMTSQGQVLATQLRPEVFEELSGSNRRHVSFTAQELVLMDGTRLPRPDGVQDTASQFVELTHRFSQAQIPLTVGQSVQVWLARPGGADVWTYDVVDLETLYTPRLGPVPAFHLRPRTLANPRGPISAEMWFAPTLQYLPVRIKITMNEQTWVDLLVDRIEQTDASGRP